MRASIYSRLTALAANSVTFGLARASTRNECALDVLVYGCAEPRMWTWVETEAGEEAGSRIVLVHMDGYDYRQC